MILKQTDVDIEIKCMLYTDNSTLRRLFLNLPLLYYEVEGSDIMSYITGNMIKELRTKKKMTQKQLADILLVSDKTVSKWETGRGLPDIGIIDSLASALGVSLAELLVGEITINKNRSANLKKSTLYVCPICGNVIISTGNGTFSCCGVTLPVLETENEDDNHLISVKSIDNEYYISIDHTMSKDHYISFVLYVTTNRYQLIKLYPEQMAEGRFNIMGHGFIYAYCNVHGLFRVLI